MRHKNTICAISTASGGAIGIIRVTGMEAIPQVERIFSAAKNKKLSAVPSHRLTFGHIGAPGEEPIDEVLVSIFRAPNSYTGEDLVEISCHGSSFILQKVLELLIDGGCRPADPGEFTQRAFLNGKMDLSQAEAVADIIASNTAANHRIAMKQMRGEFSRELLRLRERLLKLTSLLELELDFSDHEDLEFADRSQLDGIASEIEIVTSRLADSFATGNALKHGFSVAIVGSTNSGKSTLLNTLLHDDRAIVSDIHGTTRDVIEDTYSIEGTLFRFIDTAGLRHTEDVVEKMGIERSWQKIKEAQIVLFVVDSTQLENQLTTLGKEIIEDCQDKHLIVLFNKCDLIEIDAHRQFTTFFPEHEKQKTLTISAKNKSGIDNLIRALLEVAHDTANKFGDLIITNARHYAALTAALEDIRRVREGLSIKISGDFIAQDLRSCLFHLAEITGGEITTDEVLGSIFRNFCVGK